MYQATSAPLHPRSTPRRARGPTLLSDLVFDGFFGGWIGASAIGLVFLVADAMQGRPLFTPSLMGAVLFTQASPLTVAEVRLDMVAYFTIVHLATFALLAVGISWLCRHSRLVEGHPGVISSVVFGILTATIVLADLTLMRGIVSALGFVPVLVANALTGVSMATFFRWSHRPGRYGGPTAP